MTATDVLPRTTTAPPVLIVLEDHELVRDGLERQLLEAYALGLSNEETATKLCLSVRSVQTYSGNLLKKLGTNNRQRALRRAISLGLTELTHLFDND